MKRFRSSGRGKFARFGLRPHQVRTNGTYRGGIRL